MSSKFIFLIFVLSLLLLSKETRADSLNVDENTVSYYDDFNFKVILNSKYNNLLIQNEALPNDVLWRTNDNNTIGIGANYKWFGLNLLFNIPALNDDDHIYGKTQSFNIISNIYTKSLGIDLFLQETQGFFLENPGDWFSSWSPEMAYPHNPALRVVTLGGNLLYVYNSDEYSLRSNFILNERQLKSAGSPILGGYINFFAMESDSSILPFTADTIAEYELDIREAGYINLGAFAGYSHTFIYRKYFFLSLTGALGLALQGSEINTFDPVYNDGDAQGINAKFHLRAALGFSNDQNFISLALIADNNGLGKSLNYNFGYARLTYGYRIKTKKRKPGQ